MIIFLFIYCFFGLMFYVYFIMWFLHSCIFFLKIIKQKDGKNRGFAFVTMASGEGAQAAIEKFDSHVSYLCSLKFSNYAISTRGILEVYCQCMCSTSVLDCGW